MDDSTASSQSVFSCGIKGLIVLFTGLAVLHHHRVLELEPDIGAASGACNVVFNATKPLRFGGIVSAPVENTVITLDTQGEVGRVVDSRIGNFNTMYNLPVSKSLQNGSLEFTATGLEIDSTLIISLGPGDYDPTFSIAGLQVAPFSTTGLNQQGGSLINEVLEFEVTQTTVTASFSYGGTLIVKPGAPKDLVTRIKASAIYECE